MMPGEIAAAPAVMARSGKSEMLNPSEKGME
jgi:hypothetical protein